MNKKRISKKRKIAQKMITQEEIRRNVKVFDSFAWTERKKEKRLKQIKQVENARK